MFRQLENKTNLDRRLNLTSISKYVFQIRMVVRSFGFLVVHFISACF